MAFAIVQHGYGGVDVLRYEEIALPDPGPDEVRIRHCAIGLNFHDLYVREGTNRALALPGIPGIEAVGEVGAVGERVRQWSVGDRVAYISRGYGAYSTERNISARLLLRPPAGLSDDIVACSLVRGLTAAVLLTALRPLDARQSVLVHTASGSMGRLLCDWAKHLGARVVGTVGAPDRKRLVPDSCDEIFLHTESNWPEQVRSYLGGGADYVLDSIGAPTFLRSLDAAAVCGHVSLYGQAGGAVENVPVAALAKKSLTVSRPIVFDWYCSGAAVERLIGEFYALLDRNVIHVNAPLVLPLTEAGKAQLLLQERRLDRSIVLRPD